MRNNTKAGGGSFGLFWVARIWDSKVQPMEWVCVCVMRKQSGEDVKSAKKVGEMVLGEFVVTWY